MASLSGANSFAEYTNDKLTKEEAQEFVSRISPPRDLICPITISIFQDPVIALGDGQTYERNAIETWLQTQRNPRSPVTNAFMDGDDALKLVTNKAVGDMAARFRENLGRDLVGFAKAIDVDADLPLGDKGFRIKNILEIGADLSVCIDGENAFEVLIKKGRVKLLQLLLSHEAHLSVLSKSNVMVEMIKKKIDQTKDQRAWRDILRKVEERAQLEFERKQKQDEARNQYNSRHRNRQQELANEARSIGAMNRNGTVVNGSLIQNGLGELEDGIGYFPSLSALQFQGSVPPPPSSFAEYELKEQKRLNFIIKCLTGSIMLMWLLC
jgi:hypothetical protein